MSSSSQTTAAPMTSNYGSMPYGPYAMLITTQYPKKRSWVKWAIVAAIAYFLLVRGR
jgi:hypothetical protein